MQALFHLSLDVGRSPFVCAHGDVVDQVGADAFHSLVNGEFSGLRGYNSSCVNAESTSSAESVGLGTGRCHKQGGKRMVVSY